MNHRATKKTLDEQWTKLEEQQNEEKKEKKELEAEKERAKQQMEQAKAEKKEVKQQLGEKIKQIDLLRQERGVNEEKLTKREKDLYKYKFKIKDLKKSKHVLTHRTTEMKASLQPKEAQIERQKEKLLELEGEFEKRVKLMNDKGDALTKYKAKITQLHWDYLKQR